MYLFFVFFWLVVGALFQIYWASIQPLALIPVDRYLMGLICFIMFSYSFLRWRMTRARKQTSRDADESRSHRAAQPIDPTFDFSDSEPPKEQRNDPPAK